MDCLISNTSTAAILPSKEDDLHFIEVWLSCFVVSSTTLLGLFSNILALILTSLYGARSRFHTVFIANLAITDFLSIILSPTDWLVFVGVFEPSATTLVFLGAVKKTFKAASAAGVVSITLDRLCLACSPIRYHLREGTTRACLLIIFMWTLCISLHAPIVIVCDRIRFYLTIALVAAEFVIPLIVLSLSNCTIYRQIFRNRQLRTLRRHSGTIPPGFLLKSDTADGLLKNRKQSMPCLINNSVQSQAYISVTSGRTHSSLLREATQNSSTASSLRGRRMSLSSLISRQRDSEELIKDLLQRQHRRALRTLVFIVLLFFFCRLPYTIYHILCAVFPDNISLQNPRIYCYISLLQYINSALDPLVYALWGNKIYKEKVWHAVDKVVVGFLTRFRSCSAEDTDSRDDKKNKNESSPLVVL